MKRGENIKIRIDNAEFNVRVLGNGIKNIIAFHGFGQDGFAFSHTAQNNPEYTFYSIELPFHGESKISDPTLYISEKEITALVTDLTNTAEIDRFSLIGFSIGAKFVFPAAQIFPERVKEIWLIAPDGIILNFWYRLATSTSGMRWVFRKLLHHPKVLRSIVRSLSSIGLIDNRTMKFILNSVPTGSAGDQVVKTWIYLKDLKINIDDLAEQLNKTGVKVIFVLGTKDTTIPEKMVAPLNNKIINSKTVFLDCGHQSLLKNFSKLNLENLN